MRLTIHLPDGDLTLDFTPRETEPEEHPPMVDQKPAAQVETAYQDDGPAHVLGFQPGVLR